MYGQPQNRMCWFCERGGRGSELAHATSHVGIQEAAWRKWHLCRPFQFGLMKLVQNEENDSSPRWKIWTKAHKAKPWLGLGSDEQLSVVGLRCVWIRMKVEMRVRAWWRTVVNATTWHMKRLDCCLLLGSQRGGQRSPATQSRAGLMPKQTTWPGLQRVSTSAGVRINF